MPSILGILQHTPWWVFALLMPARQAALAHWDVAVSGIGAGYFLGWLIRRFASRYRAAAPVEPAGAVLRGTDTGA